MPTNENQKTVVVVEDDPFISDLLQTILAEEGYQAVPAYDGSTALELVHELKPALVTLDLALPRTDGPSVLECLKRDASTRHIPVIVLSAYSDELCRRARNLAARVVQKPFELTELLQAVAEVA